MSKHPYTDGVASGSELIAKTARWRDRVRANICTPSKRVRSRTQDGFANFAARLGLGQDNQLSQGRYTQGNYITRRPQELEDMYRSSWVVDRMVNVVAEDMLRGGLDVRSQLPPDQEQELLRAHARLGIHARLSDAIKWGRLYGGALAVLLIDGHALSTPLRMEDVGRHAFKGLYVLDRWQVTPSQEKITELGPSLGYPASYTVNVEGLAGETLHHSRCIRFVGVELPWRQRMAEQWWGASVVDKCLDRILALDSATHGTANMLFKSFLRVIGVNQLRSILAAGGKVEGALVKMFDMIRQLQTNEGITLLDKDDTFTTHGYSFAGIYDALQAFTEQISGATGIPLVRLLGQSPKGFSSGESDVRTYYDTIATQQEDDLRGPEERIFSLISWSLFGRALPDGFSFDFRSLWEPTELEKSQIATADAQSVAGLHAAGIIDRPTALAELRAAARITGRFAGITDAQIQEAKQEAEAPALPEGMGGMGLPLQPIGTGLPA